MRWCPHRSLVGGWVIVLASLPCDAAAQYRFDSWNTENGLPQNSVSDIVQTRDGYLWLATEGGLVRFDGLRFVVFDRSTPGIESVRIRALYQDKQNTLWAGTEDGMLIRYRHGQFTTYNRTHGLPHTSAARIDEDDRGHIWVTWVGSLTKFDGQRFVTVRADHFAGRVMPPPANHYREAWWSQDASGVYVLVGGEVQRFSSREVKGARITRVTVDGRANIWMNTNGTGIIKASRSQLQQYTMNDGLPRNDFNGDIREGHDGELWLTDRGKLYRVKNGKHQVIELPGSPPQIWHSFYVDDEGSSWFGTTTSGLHRFADASVVVHGERDGVSLRIAYSILVDHTGTVWIASQGLKRYANGRVTSYRFASGESPDQVTSIYEDRAGRLWVGTSGGLRYLDHGRFSRYDDPSGFLKHGVWAIHQDRFGAFWFATSLGLVKSTNGQFTRYTTQDGLSHDRVSAFFEDRSGALWIGALQGVTRLKNGVFTAYKDERGFIGSNVRAFHEDSDGTLWIGTYDAGLYRLAGERLTRFTRADGLHDNGVFQILEDADGFFWMGSNRGISRVSRRELNDVAHGRRRFVSPVVLGPSDGLSNVEVNGGQHPSAARTADGKLWFPTMEGLAVVDPAAIRVPRKPPPAIVEEVRLKGSPVDFTGAVRVRPDASGFEIRYTAPTFVKPDQVRFRYRLAGLDDRWIEAGDRRLASFHGVPPGHYRFEVSAASQDGVWSTVDRQAEFVVVPPFWRTWWFIALVLGATVSIALAGHEHRVRGLRKLHAVQEEFSQRLIDSQEGERRRVSSEMHDSLGQHLAIIKRRTRTGREIVADRAAVEEALEEIGVLTDRISAEMKEIAYDLRPHQLDTIGLTKTIENMVHRIGKSCDIAFDMDIAFIDDQAPEASHIHIFRIIQEAVSNIVTHSQATSARIAVVSREASVQIVVQDNGVGFNPTAATARPITHGAGLVGMRERVRMLGGRVEIQSSAQAGTTVRVSLPLVDRRASPLEGAHG